MTILLLYIPISCSGSDKGPGESSPVGDTGAMGEADLVFDAGATGQAVLGFGAQVWPGDTAWEAPLAALGARFARMALNPGFGSLESAPPEGASAAEMDAWVSEHLEDAYPTLLSTYQETWFTLEEQNITTVMHLWEAPPAWESDGVLDSARVDDFAQLWASVLVALDAEGVRPRWVELVNEPDGTWNTCIWPDDYRALVIATRAALDARGLEDVGILGPGRAVIAGWTGTPEADDWVAALGEEGAAALDGFSTHTWDDYAEDGEGLDFVEARWQAWRETMDAVDPDKPVFVTELGSKDMVFDGIPYLLADTGTCGNAAATDGYALRVLGHALIAARHGVVALSSWQAADQSWECSRWGLVDQEGQPRRAHEALTLLWSRAPEDAVTLAPAGDDGGMVALGLLGADRLVVALVNDTGEAITRSLGFPGLELGALSEVATFGVDERLLVDELNDLSALEDASASLGIDSTNVSYFDGDPARLYRTAREDASAVWSVPGALTEATLVAWRWPHEDAPDYRLEASADGVSWEELSFSLSEAEEDPSLWIRVELRPETLPEGSARLRLTLLEHGGNIWNPQIGDVWLRYAPAATASLPAPGPVTGPQELTLPSGAAVVLVYDR